MTHGTESVAAPIPDLQERTRTVARRVNPVLTVARKEWLDLRRDPRWRAFIAITTILMLASLVLGLQRIDRLEREHAAAETGDRHVWTAQGSKNPHSAAHFGQYAFKPAGPLSLADPGIDAYVGNSVWLEAHKQNEVQFRAARDSALFARMGHLTPAFVLQAVFPLIAILLGFASFAGEREAGTLPQLLSLGVSPTHLLLGKALAAMGVLAVLLVLSCLLMGAGLMLFGPADHQEAGLGLRLVGMLLTYGVYLTGFLALSMAVSARSKSSRSALVGLLAFWVVTSFVAPRVASDIAQKVHPLPTTQAFRDGIAEEKKSTFGHDETHPGFIAFRNRILSKYAVSRVEDLPVSFRGLSLREDDEAGYRIFDRHYGKLQSEIDRQDATRSLAGLLFPTLALQPISMAMAGTDNHHHHHFVRAAEGHRRLVQTAASQDLIDHARNGDSNYVAPADLWEKIPPLHYAQPGAGWAWRGQIGNLVSLGLWTGFCCLFAWRAALRT